MSNTAGDSGVGIEQKKGTFIVIEGTDASGKSTQYEALKNHLVADGHDVVDMHFPRYDKPSSYFVKEYLAGSYGSAENVGPYTGSLFYALDRYQAAAEIRQALDEGKIVLCDRYVGSNMAHQGSHFEHPEQMRGYFIWLDNLEFEMLGIPRPDLNFVLNAPLEVIKQRLKERDRSSTAIKNDILEDDEAHIAKSLEVYKDLCQLFPKDFLRLDTERGGKILSIEEVHKLIWEKVSPMLKPIDSTSDISQPLLEKINDQFSITEAGKDYLDKIITNTDDNIYAFTDNINPITVAAAMARLSRRGDDMRITLLDEFAGREGKDQDLLKRVITAYGDDSVQQLVGQHLVVENASNLLTKKLEWGRLAAYLEQSTRYIYFDKKTPDGKYRYYVPEHFSKKLKQKYTVTMDSIFDTYSNLVHKLTDHIKATTKTPKVERDAAWNSAVKAQACDAARPVLPVATTSTVGIYASGQALEGLIMHLLADDLPEARITGKKILKEARKVIPTFLERADKPDRGGAATMYRANTRRDMQLAADEFLPAIHSSDQEPVTLSNYWPKNELDLVPDMLYEHSQLSLSEIRRAISSESYETRLQIFNSYMGERLNRRHKPGRALENAHYSFDLTCDYGIFRDLQRHRMVDDLRWQELSPRFGYEVPDLVEEAGLIDLFETCFDLSLTLHSALQAAGFTYESQYATLLGHKMRWKVTYNAREAFHFHELRTSPQGHPGYRKLVNQMHDAVANVHPLMAEAMKFVNQDEDPELARLAAERYTQFKLQEFND